MMNSPVITSQFETYVKELTLTGENGSEEKAWSQRIKNVGFARHRYDSSAKPGGRVVLLFLLCSFSINYFQKTFFSSKYETCR